MIGIVMLGVTTSGKSTIGKHLANELGLRYISSGDIARQMHVDELLNKGELAPEDEMRKRILEAINDTQVSYVLDGCPRFYEQYAWLKGSIDHRLVFIDIYIAPCIAFARSAERMRDDDKFASVQKKIDQYIDAVEPMIRYIAEHEKSYYRIANNDREDAKKPIALAIARYELNGSSEI